MGLFARAFAVLLATVGSAAAQPNIITILADDLSMLEFERRVMPNVFRYLVDRGTTFRNYHVNHPVCGPSLATLHTGQYAHNHGLMLCREDPLSLTKDTLLDYIQRGSMAREGGKRFHDAGWYASMIGKWSPLYSNVGLISHVGQPLGFVPAGWDDWYVPLQLTYHAWNVSSNGSIQTHTNKYVTDALASRAIATIDAAKAASKPLFMNFWMPNPHRPLPGPEKSYPDRVSHLFVDDTVPVDGDLYAPGTGKHPGLQDLSCSPSPAQQNAVNSYYRERLRSMKAADQALGRIFRHLEATGELDNTIIVFTSDNGFKLGHWCLIAKLSPYYRDVNVPFVMAGPGIPQGVRNEVISTVDVLPTMMDLCGLPADPIMDGQSFAHFFTGGTCWRRWASIELWTLSRLTWKGDFFWWRYRAIKSRSEKFIVWHDGHEEHYGDRLDLINTVSGLDLAKKTRLQSQITQRATCSGMTCHQWDVGDCSP